MGSDRPRKAAHCSGCKRVMEEFQREEELQQNTKNMVPESSRGNWIHYWRKKMLHIWRQWLLFRKFLSCKMLEAMRVPGHVTLDPCAAAMLFPRNSRNLHLRLMKARNWAGLSIHPEWLFSICHGCVPCSYPLSGYMLALLFTSLLVNSGMCI